MKAVVIGGQHVWPPALQPNGPDMPSWRVLRSSGSAAITRPSRAPATYSRRVTSRLRKVRLRAADLLGQPVDAAAVFKTYDPRVVAGAFTAALGAASFGQGGQGASAALDDILTWGDREASRFASLPDKLLVVTTAEEVCLFEWPVEEKDKPVARWSRGSFAAKLRRKRIAGQVNVFVAPHGLKPAVLWARTGPFRRAPVECARALTRLSSTPEAT